MRLFTSRPCTKELDIKGAQLSACAGFRFNLCFSVALHLAKPQWWTLTTVCCLLAFVKKTIQAIAQVVRNARTGIGLCNIIGGSQRFVGSV